MSRRLGFSPVNLPWFNRILKWSYGRWLSQAYHIEVRGGELLKSIPPPYVLISNHVTTRDPFLISVSVPRPVWWVASDSNLRTSLMRFVLGLVGTIPKAKAIPDLETVNLIVEVIRKRRGIVGLFPEGQQSWDGRTLPLFQSTAKLLKLLKVPVIAVRIEGGYLSLPRWTWKRRSGKVILDFSMALTPEELKALSAEDIMARLERSLSHDEFDWQLRNEQIFQSRRRAEHVELALFICPDCKAIGTLRSLGARLRCRACGESTFMDRRGFFRKELNRKVHFDSIPSWDRWQLAELDTQVATFVGSSGALSPPLFFDTGVMLFRGRGLNPLRRINTGRLSLFADRIELSTLGVGTLSFPISGIRGVSVHKRNIFEFYIERNLYQFRFPFRSVSGRKWLVAVESLKRMRG